jgi:general L-amino acid transport system permease protein
MTTVATPEEHLPDSRFPAALARPETPRGILAWLRRNLFRTWLDSLLTLIVVYIVFSLLLQFVHWATAEAQWTVITVNFRLLMQGMYPIDQGWRLALSVVLVTILAGASWGIWGKIVRTAAILFVAGVVLFTLVPLADTVTWSAEGMGLYMGEQLLPLLRTLRDPALFLLVCLAFGYLLGRAFKAANRGLARRTAVILWLLMFPIVFLLVRGISPETPGLPLVRTNQWGGLLLTFMLAFVAIVTCFPLGVALALGRTSGGSAARVEGQGLRNWWRSLGPYPIIKLFCIVYIEFLRGVPLVTVFFTASLIVPLALGDADIDSVVRAMVGMTLFQAAYVAEVVRGGLQAVPPGQVEAARAVGLSPVQVTLFITLPQALRVVLPALVGQFITAFKDTSLVAIIGLLDLVGISRSVLVQPGFVGRHREVYVFVAIIYFTFSYGMSYASRQLERSGSGQARPQA